MLLYHKATMTLNNQNHPVLLRRAEACSTLGISLSTYKLLVGKGAIREVAIGERARRLPLSEVERYVAERLGESEARTA